LNSETANNAENPDSFDSDLWYLDCTTT